MNKLNSNAIVNNIYRITYYESRPPESMDILFSEEIYTFLRKSDNINFDFDAWMNDLYSSKYLVKFYNIKNMYSDDDELLFSVDLTKPSDISKYNLESIFIEDNTNTSETDTVSNKNILEIFIKDLVSIKNYYQNKYHTTKINILIYSGLYGNLLTSNQSEYIPEFVTSNECIAESCIQVDYAAIKWQNTDILDINNINTRHKLGLYCQVRFGYLDEAYHYNTDYSIIDINNKYYVCRTDFKSANDTDCCNNYLEIPKYLYKSLFTHSNHPSIEKYVFRNLLKSIYYNILDTVQEGSNNE